LINRLCLMKSIFNLWGIDLKSTDIDFCSESCILAYEMRIVDVTVFTVSDQQDAQ
jgi:hypothetical protein